VRGGRFLFDNSVPGPWTFLFPVLLFGYPVWKVVSGARHGVVGKVSSIGYSPAYLVSSAYRIDWGTNPVRSLISGSQLTSSMDDICPRNRQRIQTDHQQNGFRLFRLTAFPNLTVHLSILRTRTRHLVLVLAGCASRFTNPQ